jgi:hypothetical protein
VIAVVAMFPLISMFANATANSVEPELVTQAVFLAQERIEMVLADYHFDGCGYDYVVDANYTNEPSIPEFPGFASTISIAAQATYDGVDYKEVSVTITHGAIAPVTLTTWVTR